MVEVTPVTLTIRSRIAPPVTVTVPGQPGGTPNVLAQAALHALQPAVEASIAGQSLGTWAPAGDPGPGTPGWVLAVVVVFAVVLGSIGLYTVTKGLR